MVRKSDEESIIEPENNKVKRIEAKTKEPLRKGINNITKRNTGTLCKEEDRKRTKLGKR